MLKGSGPWGLILRAASYVRTRSAGATVGSPAGLGSLTAQFTRMSVAAVIVEGLVMATWATLKLESSAKRHAGSGAARNVADFVEPAIRKLGLVSSLSLEEAPALREATRALASRRDIVAIKVWGMDGTLLHATNGQATGRHYGENSSLALAASGGISVEFDMLDAEESRLERAIGVPMLEIYAPLRNAAGQVIGVIEFYEDAKELADDLFRLKVQAWLVSGFLCGTMILLLIRVVDRGSDTIDRQRAALTERVRELTSLLQQNGELRKHVERVSRQAAEQNEAFLRRVGADLHDGPAQLLGFALLRLDALAPSTGGGRRIRPRPELGIVRGALADAMRDLRNICSGLVMPEVEELTPAEALEYVITSHEGRTGTTVARQLADLLSDVPALLKISLCRFVQEGLSNASRHAAGKGQRVSSWVREGTLFVEVADEGLGLETSVKQDDHVGLGLIGMKSRIESLGGFLRIESIPGGGTRVTAALPITVRLEEEAS